MSKCRSRARRAPAASRSTARNPPCASCTSRRASNIFVQDQRSQHQNKDIAYKRLKARLYEIELKKREDKAMADQASKTDIGWGHQIRSYVLQPYQMVKDLRTGVQTSDTSGVLDGDIDQFIETALASRIKGTAGKVEDIE